MTQLSPIWPPSNANYRPERDEYYTWDDYNEQLLRSRFSTGRLADEYRGIIIGFGGEGSERQKLNELAHDYDRKMRTLGLSPWKQHLIADRDTTSLAVGRLRLA
jgi:hypothetical protein